MRTHLAAISQQSGNRPPAVRSAIGYWLSALTGRDVPRPVRRLPGHLFVAALALALPLAASAQPEVAVSNFPNVVPFQVGDIEFAPGDNITIQRVTGTSATIRTGETYCVEGTYTLASKDAANLALYATTKSSVATPTDPSQIMRVKKGQGTFRLVKVMRDEGYLHVSFYPVPSGSAFGGVYFGQESGVLRHKGWSYLNQNAPSPDYTAAGSASSAPISVTGPNRALLEYLGDPVQPPPNPDPAYTKEALINAIRQAAQRAGITVKRVEIDDSEFPFLVGTICKEGDLEKLTAQLRNMPPYAYHGSVSSSTHAAFNIVPYEAYPRDAAERISRRSGLRCQVFIEKLEGRP